MHNPYYSDNKLIKIIKENQKAALAAFILIFCIIAVGIENHNSKKINYDKNVTQAWNSYNNGLAVLQKKYISFEDSQNAKRELYTFSEDYKAHLKKNGESVLLSIINEEKYKDATTLYLYAQAIHYFRDLSLTKLESCQLALDSLDSIPTGYSGLLAQEILSFKQEVKSELDKNKKLLANITKAEELEKNSAISIGDPDLKVIKIYGEPTSKNKIITENKQYEQWVYPNNFYIYIENGTVTSWQLTE